MSGVLRQIWAALLCVMCAFPAVAQDLGALARFEDGSLRDRWGGAELHLELSQGVPWRVFTLSNPNRLVMDFREVQWGDVAPGSLIDGDRFKELRMGAFRPGWSRLVAELNAPMVVDQAALTTDEVTGAATVTVRLETAEQTAFDAAAGAPRDAGWDLPEPADVTPVPPRDPSRLRIVLDPGHGGIDPGAERGDVREAHLMLTFARELQEVLTRAGGFDVLLTRNGDFFVSLEARVAFAREAQADLFISLHADALAEGVARGAAVYTLSEEASDAASAALAERHNRNDLLAGVDLTRSDDQIANVLMSLARQENAPRSEALAEHLIGGIKNAVGRVHKRPIRSAGFSVLKAADIPSVLLEVGFLSTEADLKNLTDPIWRQGMAAGIRDGLLSWQDEDLALAPLRRR